MKLFYFILLLLSFSTSASWIKNSDVGVSRNGIISYTSKSLCGSNCTKVGLTYNPQYSSLTQEMVNDYDNPIKSIVETEACATSQIGDELSPTVDTLLLQGCRDRLAAKVCPPDYTALSSKDWTELYCYRVSYNKIPTGRKVIIVDEEKKAEFDLMALKKSDQDKLVASGEKTRAKCEEALSYVTGLNSSEQKTKEEIDLMISTFYEVHQALLVCHTKLARVELAKIDNAEYNITRDVIISILE